MRADRSGVLCLEMFATTVVHVCPQGGGERLQKNGHTQRGAQRARCLDCQRTFPLAPQGPRHRETLKAQVLAAYQDRMSTRGVQRPCAVCYQTRMKWVGEKDPGSPGVRGRAFAWPGGRCARTG